MMGVCESSDEDCPNTQNFAETNELIEILLNEEDELEKASKMISKRCQTEIEN